MTIRHSFLAISIVCIFSYPAVSQSDWPSQHVDKRTGLSNSAVNTMYMDHLDHVWMGTWDGLNRYDGEEMVVYKPQTEDSSSISNNIIRQLLEDKDQNLWIVTHGGINRYNPSIDRFQRYFHDRKDLPFVENNLKATLSSDSTLYVSLIGWGIGRYDYQSQEFVKISIPDLNRDGNYTIGVHHQNIYTLDEHGKMVTLTSEGAVQLQLPWSPTVSFKRFFSLQDKLYLVYQYQSESIAIIQLQDGKIEHQITISSDFTQLSAMGISRDQQKVFLGTEDGRLLQLSFVQGLTTSKWLTSEIANISERKLKIFSIYESDQNILWIGTDGDGAYKYLTRQSPFKPISPGDPLSGHLSHNIVRSILVENDKVWAGTRGGGLNVVTPGHPTLILDKFNKLSDNTVLSLTLDKQKRLWIGLDDEGIDMIENTTGKSYHFPRDFVNPPENLFFGSVYEIFIDAYGHLWLGTSGHGVVYLDIEKTTKGYKLKEYYTLTPDASNDEEISLKSNIIYSIMSEEPNMLWFGSRNGGLYRFNSLTRKFTHHLEEGRNNRYSLSNNDVLSLYLNQNQLWVGTSGGLNVVNLSDFTVSQYTQTEGLANNTIHGILEDKMGRLWLSSNQGLFAFTPETNSFKNFNWTDGLLNLEYTDGAYFQAPGSDILYFGGTNGIDRVYPTQIDTIASFPRLELTGFYLNNIQVTPSDSLGILNTMIDFKDEIRLRHDQNFLTFRFTTLDFWHKQRCNYRYRLVGFDKDWIEIGKQSSINLTNIPPGDYTLMINNSNENGDWNPSLRRLSIIISPPFWATTTAYIIYMFVAILAQIGLVQIFRNRTKRKKAKEIRRLKKEHEDTIQKYKLEFFTDIAHEFRTPLTLILGPATKLLEKLRKNTELYNSAQSIYRNSLRLQKLIQELIQFRKVEMGKQELRIRPINFVTFTEDLLQSFKQYALDKNISLTLEAPESLDVQADPDLIEKILINLISNALKYTDQEGSVHIKIWKDEDRMYCSVSDNGIGIASKELDRIFERFINIPTDRADNTSNSAGIGLSLTKKLVNLHKGEIEMESTLEKGTMFTFWIPASLPTQEQQHQLLTEPTEHDHFQNEIGSEFLAHDHLNQELINLSLEHFDYNILVVDDNEQILALVKDLLSDQYNVRTTNHPHEALSLLKSKKIDLVISDIIMPDMSGYDFCHEIKSKIETSHIPVILLTAKGELEERIEGLKAGADAYIPKPFHPHHLLVRVQKLIETRQVLKQRFESFQQKDGEFSGFGIGEKDDDFFKKLDLFIKNEMSNPQLDAQHLANHLGLSKSSLYKKIRTLTGQTPHALINQYRLKRAAYLLASTDLNVSEVIYKIGFNSRSYFYKSFQELFNCSPSAYEG